MEHDYEFPVTMLAPIVLVPVPLKLFDNHIAVSLGDTFSGPNGFSKTANSSIRSCCISCALNSNNPSNASARCWYDDVSNLRLCPDDVSSPPLVWWLWLLLGFTVLTVHMSIVTDRFEMVFRDVVDEH